MNYSSFYFNVFPAVRIRGKLYIRNPKNTFCNKANKKISLQTEKNCYNVKACIEIQAEIWARSSAGRAPRSQCGGREFDPLRVHHKRAKRTPQESLYGHR